MFCVGNFGNSSCHFTPAISSAARASLYIALALFIYQPLLFVLRRRASASNSAFNSRRAGC